jgi:hypothetical protein
MLGGLAASGVGNTVKAKKQSTAAKKAAEEQQRGTREASGYQREALNQLGQLYSPYLNNAASAARWSGQLTTPGPQARFASPGPPDAMPQPTSPYGQNPPGQGFFGKFAQSAGQGMGRFAIPRSPGNMRGFGRNGGYAPMQMPNGEPIDGPYPMAAGGDVMVDRPTMFLAGEAGPERATFSGGPPPGRAGMSALGGRPGVREALLAKYAPKPMPGGPGQGPMGSQMAPPNPPNPPSPPRPPGGMYGGPSMPSGPFGQMMRPPPGPGPAMGPPPGAPPPYPMSWGR